MYFFMDLKDYPNIIFLERGRGEGQREREKEREREIFKQVPCPAQT